MRAEVTGDEDIAVRVFSAAFGAEPKSGCQRTSRRRPRTRAPGLSGGSTSGVVEARPRIRIPARPGYAREPGVGESVLDDEVEGGVVDLVEAESGGAEFGPDDLGVRVAEQVLGGLLS